MELLKCSSSFLISARFPEGSSELAVFHLLCAEGRGDRWSLRMSEFATATALSRGKKGPACSESTRAGNSRVDGSDARTLAAITGGSVELLEAARQSPARVTPGFM